MLFIFLNINDFAVLIVELPDSGHHAVLVKSVDADVAVLVIHHAAAFTKPVLEITRAHQLPGRIIAFKKTFALPVDDMTLEVKDTVVVIPFLLNPGAVTADDIVVIDNPWCVVGVVTADNLLAVADPVGGA